ncbi:MAG: hypothetical protein ABSC92_18005, partial [Rhizomicrobium sp.]
MHVKIHEPRQEIGAVAFNHMGIGWDTYLCRGTDFRDASISHDDALVGQDDVAIHRNDRYMTKHDVARRLGGDFFTGGKGANDGDAQNEFAERGATKSGATLLHEAVLAKMDISSFRTRVRNIKHLTHSPPLPFKALDNGFAFDLFVGAGCDRHGPEVVKPPAQ